ncbi:cysteine desulfurase family protein [Alloiococcus sp. CFN-8]|uniref:cysteine desulfurase family protein n=1 Tax=Alloiococcus sp. CFN-8 TaxID=3416081 RepID=UPI003CFA7A6E
MTIYFDNGATTKPYKEVIEKVADIMENNYGNPSSVHKLGLAADKALREARKSLGAIINCSEDEIIFTSGGSESNNFIISSYGRSGGHVITTEIEHASVRETYGALESRGVKVTYLKVDPSGRVDIEALGNAINKDTLLVSIMYVNNEIGTIQDIKEIGRLIKEKSSRAKFHVDAVQGFCKLPIDVKAMNIDFLSAGAHKIHGPKGVGLCYIKKNNKPEPLIYGGSQEQGLRAGTVNVPGAVGFALAAEITFKNMADNYSKVWELKKYFIEKLKELQMVYINSPLEDSFSPFILNVQFKGVRGEILLRYLEDKDIYVSAGAACSSKNSKDSRVLKAIGLNHEEILSSIRFSFCPDNTKEEIDRVIEELKIGLNFLRRIKR